MGFTHLVVLVIYDAMYALHIVVKQRGLLGEEKSLARYTWLYSRVMAMP